MGATALAILIASSRKKRPDRVFFYLTSGLCWIACIAYFTMGSNLGWTPINVEWLRSESIVRGVNRQVFYARYIDWYVSFFPSPPSDKLTSPPFQGLSRLFAAQFIISSPHLEGNTSTQYRAFWTKMIIEHRN
jgi:hypothetical protein